MMTVNSEVVGSAPANSWEGVGQFEQVDDWKAGKQQMF
jgi:hypothetical protein